MGVRADRKSGVLLRGGKVSARWLSTRYSFCAELLTNGTWVFTHWPDLCRSHTAHLLAFIASVVSLFVHKGLFLLSHYFLAVWVARWGHIVGIVVVFLDIERLIGTVLVATCGLARVDALVFNTHRVIVAALRHNFLNRVTIFASLVVMHHCIGRPCC